MKRKLINDNTKRKFDTVSCKTLNKLSLIHFLLEIKNPFSGIGKLYNNFLPFQTDNGKESQ